MVVFAERACSNGKTDSYAWLTALPHKLTLEPLHHLVLSGQPCLIPAGSLLGEKGHLGNPGRGGILVPGSGAKCQRKGTGVAAWRIHRV